MLMAFRRDESPYTGFGCALREIDPGAEYEVTLSAGYEPSGPQRMRGEQLQSPRLEIDEHPDSLVVEYKHLGA